MSRETYVVNCTLSYGLLYIIIAPLLRVGPYLIIEKNFILAGGIEIYVVFIIKNISR